MPPALYGVIFPELPYTVTGVPALRRGETRTNGQDERMRLVMVLAFLAVAAVAGLTGYAYLGDMEPVQRETRSPVTLDMGAGAPAPAAAPVASAPAADAAPAASAPAGEPAEAPAADTAPDNE